MCYFYLSTKRVNLLKDSSRKFSVEPTDNKNFTENFDKFYSSFAWTYDLLVKSLPVWRNWLNHALPYIAGTRILEISFGTGYLLTRYADRFQVYGIDYNAAMTKTAKANLSQKGLNAELQQADVNFLPFKENSFDTIVNTMAFSGYADGKQALTEMGRVLKSNGKLLMIDVNYPKDHNWMGTSLVRFWMAGGDIIRDMGKLFGESGWSFEEKEIGGFGSVHLYIAEHH
jgi:ubiquinone/menaquinone biosynthesis C-methylase UbiE